MFGIIIIIRMLSSMSVFQYHLWYCVNDDCDGILVRSYLRLGPWHHHRLLHSTQHAVSGNNISGNVRKFCYSRIEEELHNRLYWNQGGVEAFMGHNGTFGQKTT